MNCGRSTQSRRPSFYSLLNPFQILRDVLFREPQGSTCAITGQPFTSNFTHHCRAGNTTAKLSDIVNGVLRSFALQRRASLNLIGWLLFHIFWASRWWDWGVSKSADLRCCEEMPTTLICTPRAKGPCAVTTSYLNPVKTESTK